MFRTSPSPLAAIAAACLLTVTLPAGAAMAQKSKSKAKAEATETFTAPEVTVDIPEIVAVDSSVDEATLRKIFSGDPDGNVSALADLSASSIDIPELSILAQFEVDGESSESTFTITDINLTDVTDGVAASASIGAMDISTDDRSSFTFGTLEVTDLSISALIGIHGLAQGGDSGMQTLYSSFTSEGGTLTAPEAECTINEFSGSEVRVRPLSFSPAEFFTLVEQLDAAGDEPPPELLGQALRMYAEVLTFVEAGPMSFGGYDCTFDEGQQFTVAIGAGEADAFSAGQYPTVSLSDIEIDGGDEGYFTIGNFTVKGVDLNNVVAALEAAPDAVDETWLDANARRLIPEFGGLSIADVSIDIPDAEAPGNSITGSLGLFDLTLGNYRNGIPADIAARLKNLMVDLPEDSEEESVQQLIAMGITTIDAGFNLALAWNEATNTIDVGDISVSAENLATLALAGTITNATAGLFDLDLDKVEAAAMALAVSNLQLELDDAGLSDIIIDQVAAEQNATAADLRTVFAGVAQGTILGQLATAANAQQVAQAVSDFVKGTATTLRIELVAKEQPGVDLGDLLAAEDDPTALLEKVEVSAEAN